MWDDVMMSNDRKKSRITARRSKAHRLGAGLLSYLKLTTGLYKKDTIPDYSFDSLLEKWPYNDPHCVSDSYSQNTLRDKEVDLSICIPAFNAEKSILTLLRQIERQKTNFEFEVLIINDGSTDHTGENVAEFIEGKENCHLLQQDNAGLSAARKER